MQSKQTKNNLSKYGERYRIIHKPKFLAEHQLYINYLQGIGGLIMLILVALLASANVAYGGGTAATQLMQFMKEHPHPDVLTTSWGKPVTWEEANYGLNPNSSLVANHCIFESLAQFTRERIAPRGVHAKGAGAHGYFEVTHDVSHITDVDLFQVIGKKTPCFMRFSLSAGEKGSHDLLERSKGVSVKFYTKTGNLDFAGFNFNAFAIKDPLLVSSFVHSFKPNPKTKFRDPTMAWDFIQKVPSSLFANLMPFTARGQPKSYATTPGHAVHTYQVENAKGKVHFIKVHWFPDEGIQNLTKAEVAQYAIQPDYHSIELYNRIEEGRYPVYTLCFQVIPLEDVARTPFDITDVTMNWPDDRYPYIPVGKIVLNRNVDNYQAEVEMSAFNPGNLPLGMRAMDKIMEARTLVYKEGHYNRLGSGFNNIPINRPKVPVHTYLRDGAAPVGDNGGDSPNYYPNSFNGPAPIHKTYAPLYVPHTDPGPTNYWLVKKFYNDMSPYDLDIWLSNMAVQMNAISVPSVREGIFRIFNDIEPKITANIKAYMAKANASG